MKYFLILGTNPSLSLAEISAFFKNREVDFALEIVNKEVVLLDAEEELDVKKIIKQLGGVIKIGVVRLEVKNPKAEDFLDILELDKMTVDYKLKFGFSFYGRDYFSQNSIAMNLKNAFKKENISCRWVISKEKSLSSVVVEQNKLTGKGVDFFICSKDKKYLIGKTLAVQDFKGLSRRDYGRPERDDASGMLPPKLAQIMINLSGATKNTRLLDPFCGSGTVLSEAALLGIKNLYGSDLSAKAIEDTQTNLAWLEKNNNIDFSLQLEKIDSTQLSKKFVSTKIDIIVTEPYLGPQRGAHEIKKTVTELENLYSSSIKEFSKIMAPGGKVVMIWPVFVSRSGEKTRFFLDRIDIGGFEIVPLLTPDLLNNDFLHLSRRGGIVYGRQGQKVWREVVMLKRK